MCTHDSKHKGPHASITDNHHDKEHEAWSRRGFLQAMGLVGAGTVMVGGTNVAAASPNKLTAALADADSGDRAVVLVRLKGGNDGLNTIVPINDYDFYAQNRPSIKHDLNSLYQLSSDYGIPQSMEAMQSLWGDGQMKVVHGVGYDQQNLSHFRSSDIWASGVSPEVENTGVLGRYFEQLYPDFIINPPTEPPAIQIGSIGNLIFDGVESNYAFSVANPNQLAYIAENGVLHDAVNLPDCTYGSQLGFMRGTINTTFTYAGRINEAYEAATNAVDYDEQSLGKQLAIVARMIKGGLKTKVYLVTLGGFDTHANQVQDHANRMNQVAQGMKDFYADLESVGMSDRVVGMTFSEFGRRIEENGSNGTDHGAASPVMLFGNGLQGNGFVGTHPDLQDPDSVGNLKYSTDFRSIYATVMKDWLCIDSDIVDEALFDGNYEPIDLGFSCESLGTEDLANTASFIHGATYRDKQTFVEFVMPTAARVTVSLFDILGRDLGNLYNDFALAGPQKINVRQQTSQRLISGQYIYRISFAGQAYSKSIILK